MKHNYNKKELIVIELINLMFKIAGYEVSFFDVLEMGSKWDTDFTMTKEQERLWIKEGEKLIAKKLKYLTKESARKEMSWVVLMWGLKIEEKKI
jgi:hypothetical protein